MRASLEPPPDREVVFRVRVVRACEAVRELSWGARACSGPLSYYYYCCCDSLWGPAGAPLGAPPGPRSFLKPPYHPKGGLIGNAFLNAGVAAGGPLSGGGLW